MAVTSVIASIISSMSEDSLWLVTIVSRVAAAGEAISIFICRDYCREKASISEMLPILDYR